MQLFQLSFGDSQRDALLQLLASSTPPQQPRDCSDDALAQDVLFEALQLLADAGDVTLLADQCVLGAASQELSEEQQLAAESGSQSIVAVLLTQPEADLSADLSEELHRVCATSGVVVLVHRCSPSAVLRGNTPLRQMNVFERQLPAADAHHLLGIDSDTAGDGQFTILMLCKKHNAPATTGNFDAPFESRLESWAGVVVPDLSQLEEEEEKVIVEHEPAPPAQEQLPKRTFRMPIYARQDASIIEDKPYVDFDSDAETTPSYYDWRKYYPELQLLLDNLADLQEEALGVAGWVDWPEQHYSDGGSKDWKVVPFVYTFPAYDPSKMTWVDANCERCPKTVNLLRQLPNLRTALFSRLGPASRISAHTGWQDLANYVLRCHVSLKIPPGDTCGLWVDGEVRLHRPNGIMVFDDSKLHRAFNESDEDRLVLILDLVRPEELPLGEAQGGHTAELDNLIKLFS